MPKIDNSLDENHRSKSNIAFCAKYAECAEYVQEAIIGLLGLIFINVTVNILAHKFHDLDLGRSSKFALESSSVCHRGCVHQSVVCYQTFFYRTFFGGYRTFFALFGLFSMVIIGLFSVSIRLFSVFIGPFSVVVVLFFPDDNAAGIPTSMYIRFILSDSRGRINHNVP